jgi:hypothetical protein
MAYVRGRGLPWRRLRYGTYVTPHIGTKIVWAQGSIFSHHMHISHPNVNLSNNLEPIYVFLANFSCYFRKWELPMYPYNLCLCAHVRIKHIHFNVPAHGLCTGIDMLVFMATAIAGDYYFRVLIWGLLGCFSNLYVQEIFCVSVTSSERSLSFATPTSKKKKTTNQSSQ